MALKSLLRRDLRESAVESLRQVIVSGVFSPGERLVERDIAKRLGISRTPVREAFFHLQRDGLILESEGRGLLVSNMTIAEIAEIYQILGGLERMALRATARSSSKMVAQLEKAMQQRHRAGSDVRRIIAADLAWHHALTCHTTNLKVLDMLKAPRTLAERYERSFFKVEANQQRSIKEHETIQSIVEAGDLHEAADLVESHWLDNVGPMASAISVSKVGMQI